MLFEICQLINLQTHKLLHIFWVVGDYILAKETTAVGGDEYVVLNAYASEVLVGFEQVEIEEFSTVS